MSERPLWQWLLSLPAAFYGQPWEPRPPNLSFSCGHLGASRANKSTEWSVHPLSRLVVRHLDVLAAQTADLPKAIADPQDVRAPQPRQSLDRMSQLWSLMAKDWVSLAGGGGRSRGSRSGICAGMHLAPGAVGYHPVGRGGIWRAVFQHFVRDTRHAARLHVATFCVLDPPFFGGNPGDRRPAYVLHVPWPAGPGSVGAQAPARRRPRRPTQARWRMPS